MTNTANTPNKFLTIRTEQKLTREKMAEKLKVSIKSIENYESPTYTLPLKIAQKLSDTYGYSLDWIYGKSTKKKLDKEQLSDTNNAEPTASFLIDIRNFFSRSDGEIHFTIPNYLWNYIIDYSKISASNNSVWVKEQKIKELEIKFLNTKHDDLYHRFSVPESDFASFWYFDQKLTPFLDLDNVPKKKQEHTTKQLQELNSLISSLPVSEINLLFHPKKNQK